MGSWIEKLYHVLWAYRTTQRVRTGEMPFNLAFEIEVVIPMEIGLSSIKIQEYNEDTNATWLRANLDLIEKSRKRAVVRMAAYRQRVAIYYNVQIKAKEFQASNLVLRRAKVSKPTEQGKLLPNWEGLY